MKKLEFFLQPLVADNTFLASKSPNPKNHTQTAILQQWIVQFTQTKHQNLSVSILLTLVDSKNVQNIKKKIQKSFDKIQFFHFFQTFDFRP